MKLQSEKFNISDVQELLHLFLAISRKCLSILFRKFWDRVLWSETIQIKMYQIEYIYKMLEYYLNR